MNNPSLLLRMEHSKEGARIPVVLKTLIITVCVLSDFITFYSLFDQMFEQARWLNWFISGICALAINLFPMLINYILCNGSLTKLERILVWIFTVGTVATLSICFVIRLSSREEMFGTTTAMTSRRAGAAEMGTKNTFSMAQTATSILLGIMPVLTSLICFGLTYRNPKRAYKNTLKSGQIILWEEIIKTEADICLLDQELAKRSLETLDKARYNAAVETVELIEQYCKIVARRVLAQKLRSPDAVTRLMEENQMKEMICEKLS